MGLKVNPHHRDEERLTGCDLGSGQEGADIIAVDLAAQVATGTVPDGHPGGAGRNGRIGHLAGARQGERGPDPGHADRPPQSGRVLLCRGDLPVVTFWPARRS